ncbi:TetR/AcrR family transcriptional regulator, partial [Mycobacterium marinum]|uniref:TetR/AcrR family transcriptional regulator n=1 Tax=Mycobacterium marinum TaxID=1781 RepID=UPI0021C45A7D
MTVPTNRHELRRRSTHEALRRAALKSFARKGFAQVTVTELAREAGVTERTFFRHFPTKEAVRFQDYENQLEWLAQALAQRPVSEPLFDAVLASVAAFPHDLEVVRQAATARSELISADRIANHLRVVQSSFAQVLTAFVRDRYADVANVDLVAEV